LLDSEKAFSGLPIVDNIIGMSAADEKEFSFTFPEDYEEEELVGQEAKMEITVSNVQSRFLPELDDELAQKEGEYETVDELKEHLKEELYEQAQQRAKVSLMDDLVDDMLESVEMVYPPAAVEVEINKFVENMKEEIKRSGMEWEQFLEIQEETESDFRERWREQAETNVRRGLTLRQFVIEEKIKVTDADIDAALEDRLEKFDDNEDLREQLRNIFMQGRSFESMQQLIIEDKVYDRMKAIVSGNAPDLASLEEEDEAMTEDEEE
jgi:trigger factor